MPVWSGETPEGAKVIIEGYFAPPLLGWDAVDVAGAARVMDRIAVGNPFAKAAVEMALWDLYGQAEGKPLWKLLYPDAEPRPIPLRGSIAAVAPAGAVARARWFRANGLGALKVKVGVGGVPADLERVRAVRAEIGPSIPLGVDANGGWTVEEAVAAVRALEDCGLQYVEQPVPRGDFPALRAVRDQVGIPVMADESVWTAADVETLLALDAADIVSVYPGKMGGIGASLALARRLAEAGKVVYIGSNLELDFGTAAMAHLAVGLPGGDFDRLHSDIVGTLYHEEAFGDPPVKPRNGCIAPPVGVGLGVRRTG
jgi:L-alanine-DL-glutamate epimerase-like enolase superfamily enzyme